MSTEEEKQLLRKLNDTLTALELAKPNDRSIRDRQYAIIKTDLEKVIACFHNWIYREES